MIDDIESRPPENDQLFGIFSKVLMWRWNVWIRKKVSPLCRDFIESFELMSQTCVGPQYIEVPVTQAHSHTKNDTVHVDLQNKKLDE